MQCTLPYLPAAPQRWEVHIAWDAPSTAEFRMPSCERRPLLSMEVGGI